MSRFSALVRACAHRSIIRSARLDRFFFLPFFCVANDDDEGGDGDGRKSLIARRRWGWSSAVQCGRAVVDARLLSRRDDNDSMRTFSATG